MKRQIILFFTAMYLAFAANGQLATVIEDVYIPDDGGYANCSAYWHHLTDDYVIFHTTGKKQAMFKLVKFSNYYSGTPYLAGNYTEINYIEVPQDIYVNDIKVDGYMAYFCGYINIAPQTTLGVVGYFNLIAMATTPSVTIEWYVIDNTSILSKLVAYSDQIGTHHVASIGEQLDTLIAPNARQFILIDITDITTPVYSIQKYDFDNYEYETIHEILYNGNYVILIGYFKGISIRLYNPTGPTLWSIFDDLHIYNAYDDSFSSITHSTVDIHDNIIMSYQNYYSNIPSSMIRVIELTNMTNAASQQIFLPDKSEPQVLEYFADNNSLALMQTFQFPGPTDFNTTFIQLQHSPTASYIAPAFYRNNELYQTMTRSDFKYKDLIALSADNRWLIRDITSPLPPLTFACPYSDLINVDIPLELTHSKILHQTSPNPTTMTYYSDSKVVHINPATNDCFSY